SQCKRIQFEYHPDVRTDGHPLRSRYYTVYPIWYDFLVAVMWISNFRRWLVQYVELRRTEGKWKNKGDLFNEEEDHENRREVKLVQQSIHFVLSMLDKHQEPKPRAGPKAPQTTA